MAFDPWAATHEGMTNLTGTLANIAQMRRQDEQMARSARLSDLSYNKELAEQGALTQAFGAPDYKTALALKMKGEQEAVMTERKQKAFTTYLNTLTALDNVKGLEDATKTKIGKEFLRQNPEYAPMADNLTFVGSRGIKAARNFAEGELKDPISGQPLPKGYYETEGVWTGDATNPVKLTNYKLVVPKEEKPAIGSEFEVFVNANRQAGKTDTQILDAWNERELGRKKAGRSVGGAGMPKAPSGYRYTASGDLEPIPGGPASVKAAGLSKAEEGKIASIDITIRSINDLLTHPGRKAATGMTGGFNPLAIPGTNRKGFLAKLDTLKAQTFIPQVAALKGMGALSDAEGKKLTDAVGALDPQMPEGEFAASLTQILGDLEAAKARIRPEGVETPSPAINKPIAGAPGKRPPLSSFRKR